MASGLEGLDVGSLKIDAQINVESVRAGLDRVEQGLDDARQSAKSTFAEMDRLGGSVERIAGPLSKIGAAVSSAFFGLASLSPQIAPFLEKMKTDLFRLSNIAGDELAPAFSTASNAFAGFVDFMDTDGRPILSAIGDSVEGLVTGFGDLGTKISNLNKDVSISLGLSFKGAAKDIFEAAGPEATMALLGFKVAGPPGAAVAGGGTAAVRGALDEETSVYNAVKTIGGAGVAGAGIGAGAGALAGGVGAVPGALIGGSAGVIAGSGQVIWKALDQQPKESQNKQRMRHANKE